MLLAFLRHLDKAVSLEEPMCGEETTSLELIEDLFYVMNRPATGFRALVDHPVLHGEAWHSVLLGRSDKME